MHFTGGLYDTLAVKEITAVRYLTLKGVCSWTLSETVFGWVFSGQRTSMLDPSAMSFTSSVSVFSVAT